MGAATATQVYKDNGGIIGDGWKLVANTNGEINGIYKNEKESYFGAAYINEEQRHIIFAHRGTEKTHLKDWINDFDTATRHLNQQEAIAWYDFAKKIIEEFGPTYTYSFTGHSLGGFLAHACLWKYEDEFVKSRQGYQDAFAVTIDEPGSKELLEALQPRVENEYKNELENLDITNYLSCPNIVNTSLGHLGTVYALSLEKKQDSSFVGSHIWPFIEAYVPLAHTALYHDCDMLLARFSKEKGVPEKCMRVIDWPRIKWGNKLPSSNETKWAVGYFWHAVKSWLKGDIERGEYIGFYGLNSEQAENPETLDSFLKFKLLHSIHYRVENFEPRNLPLRNMPRNVKQFLVDLNELRAIDGIIEDIFDSNKNPEIVSLLKSYSINKRAEIVVDSSVDIDARKFVTKVREFLSVNEKFYKNKLTIFVAQNIFEDMKNIKNKQQYQIQQSMLESVMNRLAIQRKNTRNLLDKLSLKQGTVRLYKYNKPSLEELLQIKNEYKALVLELECINDAKVLLEQSLIAPDLKKTLYEKLHLEEQQLIVAKQITHSLLQYMNGNIELADKELDNLIITLEKIKSSELEKNLLLNRAYNLKAKIAAIRPAPKKEGIAATYYKELAMKYYNDAISFLPDDIITYSNFIGLLTDRARSENNHLFQLQAYDYYQKIYSYLVQISKEQIPVVYSGLAYSLIMLSQNIRQGKIEKAELDNLPEVNVLLDRAQNLLKQVVAINPKYLNAKLFLGLLFFEQQNYIHALQEIDNALIINPTHENALMHKGFVLEAMGRNDEALKCLKMAKQGLLAQKVENGGWFREIDMSITRIESLKSKLVSETNKGRAAYSVLEGDDLLNNSFDKDMYDYATAGAGVGAIYMLTKGFAEMASYTQNNNNNDLNVKSTTNVLHSKKEDLIDSASVKKDVAALNFKHGLSCFNQQRYNEAKPYLQEAYNMRVQLLGVSNEETLQAKLQLKKCDEKMNRTATQPFDSESAYNKANSCVDGDMGLRWSSRRMSGYGSQDIVNQQNIELRITNACIAGNSREILDSYRNIQNYNNWQMASFVNRIFKENIEPHIDNRVIGNFYNKLKRIVYR